MRVDGKRDILERLEDPSTEVTAELFEDAKMEIERLRDENTAMTDILTQVAAGIIAKRLNVQMAGDLKLVEEEEV